MKRTDPLALRIKLGDEQAFELLFRRYYPFMCLFANKFLNNTEEAKEVVQDVFVRLWENQEQIDPEESVRAYIFRITRNMSISRLRRRKVESAYAAIFRLVYVENQEFTAHDSLIGKELEARIADVIGNLPDECRKVFNLNRIDGLRYREIAEKLHISIKTVEAHMTKALKILRTELAEHLVIMTLLLAMSGS